MAKTAHKISKILFATMALFFAFDGAVIAADDGFTSFRGDIEVKLPDPAKLQESKIISAKYNLNAIDDEMDMPHELEVYDPLEPYNRFVYGVNSHLDFLIIEPVATMYQEVVPDIGKTLVSNVLSNLYEPINFLNGIFQRDEDMIAVSAGRFLTNTIFGIGGIFDVASTQPDLKPRVTDFGLTLKHYGAETGAYIVLPLFGPSSSRDATGRVFDAVLDPFNYKWFGKDRRIGKSLASAVKTRASLIGPMKTIKSTSIDEYAAVRSIYLQKRG